MCSIALRLLQVEMPDVIEKVSRFVNLFTFLWVYMTQRIELIWQIDDKEKKEKKL